MLAKVSHYTCSMRLHVSRSFLLIGPLWCPEEYLCCSSLLIYFENLASTVVREAVQPLIHLSHWHVLRETRHYHNSRLGGGLGRTEGARMYSVRG